MCAPHGAGGSAGGTPRAVRLPDLAHRGVRGSNPARPKGPRRLNGAPGGTDPTTLTG